MINFCRLVSPSQPVTLDSDSLATAVDCGVPPVLLDASPLFDFQAPTTYGSGPLSYTCGSDLWFARNRKMTYASCTVNGTWSVDGYTSPEDWPRCIGKPACGTIAFTFEYGAIYRSA
jgi:hypothetical protein